MGSTGASRKFPPPYPQKIYRSTCLTPCIVILPFPFSLINAQLQPSQNTRRVSLGSFNWDGYHNLEQIYAWLDELKELYPSVVTLVTIGTSYEGRDIRGIIIDFKPGERGSRPLTGMIEGGIHAREWISPATVTWIIKEFLTSNDTNVRSMAEAFVWHIFPVINPDGYAYTFSDVSFSLLVP